MRERHYHRAALALLTAAGVVALLLYIGAEAAGARRAPVGPSGAGQSPAEVALPAASGQPQESARASPAPAPGAVELAPAYHGDIVIEGTVVGTDPQDLEGLNVWCLPSGFDPYTQEEMTYLNAKTDRDGRFVVRGMPRAWSYEFMVGSKDYYGTRRLTRDGALQLYIEIHVRKLAFERLVCVDEAGQRVDKSLLQVKPRNPQRSFLYVTTGAGDPGCIGVLSRVGVDVAVGEGEVACFWYAGRGEALQACVEVPGFDGVDLTLEGNPLSRWPAGRTVQLSRKAMPSELVVYRVAWPVLSWPSEWGRSAERQPFSVLVKNTRTGYTTIVTEGRTAFVAERGASWEVRPIEMAGSDQSLPYGVREVGDEIRLEPDYPKYGFVTLKYDPGTGGPDSHAELFIDGGEFPRPRALWPGVARIGPLAVGAHKIVRQVRRGREIIRTDWLDIQVREGHSEVEW